MKLRTLILVALLATSAISLSATTAYQKKTYEIYEKYYTLFKEGHSRGLTAGEAIVFSMAPEVMTAGAAAEALTWFPMNKLEYYWNQMERELEQAESLMTPEERKKKAEEDALKARQKTSAGYLEMAIQATLMQWAAKGEFEKTADYQKRLKEEGETQFSKVCNEYFPKATFNVKPLKYDADKELYDFEIKYTLQFATNSFTHNVIVAIPLDVDAARFLSQNTPTIPIIDCVWGVYESNITPQSYKITINDKTYEASTKATDLLIKGAEILPDFAELNSLSYNYSMVCRQHIDNKEHFLAEIEKYNKRIAELDAINQKTIQLSPYYSRVPESKRKDFLLSFVPKQFKNADDIAVIEDYYNQIQANIGEVSNSDPLQPIKEYLKKSDRKKFVEAYFEEHPDSAQILQKEWVEYQCHYEYQYIYQFVVAYLDGKLNTSRRDCRESAWNNYGQYYETKEEFENDFLKGETALKEHKYLCEKLEAQVANISRCLNMSIDNSADPLSITSAFTPANKRISSLNLQGANESNNKYIQLIANIYSQLAPYPKYQAKAADLIVSTAEKVQKEYDKNGTTFSSKTEFVTAYFTPDYKRVLKSKK